jgi:hypothetical protein
MKNIPFEKRRYLKPKKPIFDETIILDRFERELKLERFECFPECLGIGYIILQKTSQGYLTIENELVKFNKWNKKDLRYVDIEPIYYGTVENSRVQMNCSYPYGFHYFRTIEDAVKMMELLPSELLEVYEVSIYDDIAQGTMFDIETHVTYGFNL